MKGAALLFADGQRLGYAVKAGSVANRFVTMVSRRTLPGGRTAIGRIPGPGASAWTGARTCRRRRASRSGRGGRDRRRPQRQRDVRDRARRHPRPGPLGDRRAVRGVPSAGRSDTRAAVGGRRVRTLRGAASRTTAPSWSAADPTRSRDRVREGLADAIGWWSRPVPRAWLPDGIDRWPTNRRSRPTTWTISTPSSPTAGARDRGDRHDRPRPRSGSGPAGAQPGPRPARLRRHRRPGRHRRARRGPPPRPAASAHVDQRPERHQRHRARPRGGRPRSAEPSRHRRRPPPEPNAPSRPRPLGSAASQAARLPGCRGASRLDASRARWSRRFSTGGGGPATGRPEVRQAFPVDDWMHATDEHGLASVADLRGAGLGRSAVVALVRAGTRRR